MANQMKSINNTVYKLVILAVVFLSGMLVGGVIAYKKPVVNPDNQFVEVGKARLDIEPKDKQEQPKVNPWNIKNKWIPKPGEECYLTMPKKSAMKYDEDRTIYIIPKDIFALKLYIKYLTASDGIGLIGLLNDEQVYCVDNPKVSVSLIAMYPMTEIAEVRIRSDVYKTLEKKRFSRTTDVEAVVLLDWLTEK